MYLLALPVLIFFLSFSSFIHSTSTSNLLNGRHLRVIWPRWSGNPKGLTGPTKGGVVLDFLSARLNFTYEMVRVEVELEPAVGGGQLNYLIDKQCDLLVHSILATIHRNEIVDLTLPWTYDYTALLIPVPDETANINAVIKPFQWRIWLGIGVSIFCVVRILNSIQQYLDRSFIKETDTMKLGDQKGAEAKSRRHNLYVFGTLLSQGEPCRSKRLPIRLVAGAWCLAAFIFVQAYSSTLFTYVVAPVNRPLINSIYDIFESSDIKLLVRVGTFDRLIKEKDNPDLYVKIAKRLNSFSNTRCALITDCVQQITPGSRNVYMDAHSFLKDSIGTEFKRTGKCNLQLAKEQFTSVLITFALPKKSPYTTTINQGLLQLQQTGLMDYWDLWFRPKPPPCNVISSTRKKKSTKNPSLSFKNLTGAFVVIAVGISLSILVFLLEQIISMVERHRRRSVDTLQTVSSNRKEESKGKLPSAIEVELD